MKTPELMDELLAIHEKVYELYQKVGESTIKEDKQTECKGDGMGQDQPTDVWYAQCPHNCLTKLPKSKLWWECDNCNKFFTFETPKEK